MNSPLNMVLEFKKLKETTQAQIHYHLTLCLIQTNQTLQLVTNKQFLEILKKIVLNLMVQNIRSKSKIKIAINLRLVVVLGEIFHQQVCKIETVLYKQMKISQLRKLHQKLQENLFHKDHSERKSQKKKQYLLCNLLIQSLNLTKLKSL